jgi:hypothetical protein
MSVFYLLNIRYFILFANIFIFFGNIIIIIEKTKKIEKFCLFKDIDIFALKFALKSHSKISRNLDNSYRIKIDVNQKPKKKTIKIYAVDVYSVFNIKKFINYKYLQEKFILKIESRNPDYLLYSTVGHNHLNPKYKNCIKISIFAENRIADFSKADYCFGNHNIIYLDRYFRYPRFIYILSDFKSNNNIILSEIREKVLINNNRKKFCGAVISNYFFTDYLRLHFIKKLNLYKKVDMGGKFNNNVGGPIKNKIEFLSKYKFSIAMENTNGDGYITEKIIESFYSGTIPIYYGDYMIDEFINPKTYILIRGPQDIDNKIKFIKDIDNNITLYKQIMKEKVLIDENIDVKVEKEKTNFFIHIFEQDKNKAKRK